MLALFTWFTTTKLGKEIGLAILILAALAGIYFYGHSIGFTDGHVAGGKETFDTLRTDMETERAKTKTILDGLDARIADKDATISQQQVALANAQQQYGIIQAQQLLVQKQISSLSDSQIVLDLASRLKIRAATDTTATLYPQEIRRADEIVGDYASVTATVDNLKVQMAAQSAQVSALTGKVDLTDQKFRAAMDYVEQSDARFAHAYNVFEELHGRPLWQKVLTFGILRNKTIKTLTPIQPLERPASLK